MEDRLLYTYKGFSLCVFMCIACPISVPFFFVFLVLCYFIDKLYLINFNSLNRFRNDIVITDSLKFFNSILLTFLYSMYWLTESLVFDWNQNKKNFYFNSWYLNSSGVLIFTIIRLQVIVQRYVE